MTTRENLQREPATFYAHIIGNSSRCVTFEAVRKCDIEMFIEDTPANPTGNYNHIKSEHFEVAWAIFKGAKNKHSLINNQGFQACKLVYLSEIENYKITFSQDRDMVKKIRSAGSQWWKITISPNGKYKIFVGEPVLMGRGKYFDGSFRAVSKKAEQRLDDMFRVDFQVLMGTQME